MVVGRRSLVGVRWDNSLLLELFVGLFGSELLGGLDGVFDGVLGRGAVNLYAHVVLATTFFALI